MSGIEQEQLEKKPEINDYMLDVYVNETAAKSLSRLAGEELSYTRHSQLVNHVTARLYEHLRKTNPSL